MDALKLYRMRFRGEPADYFVVSSSAAQAVLDLQRHYGVRREVATVELLADVENLVGLERIGEAFEEQAEEDEKGRLAIERDLR